MGIQTIGFEPYSDMKPGTGGLRQRTKVFMQPHYLEGFMQAAVNVWRAKGNPLDTFVLGGDGRYPGISAIARAAKLLLGNGVKRILITGRDGIATAPAISHAILKYKADGGFAFSASHNPGGPDGDFGVKAEVDGGQPTEAFTELLYKETLSNKEYKVEDLSDEQVLSDSRVEYIDAAGDYIELMEGMFDFDAIRKWFAAGHSFRFDAMHASTGRYARRLFVEKLGAKPDCIVNEEPLQDFGGMHPEPNPTNSKELYDFMMEGGADFAAACDGDGDRNMILGSGAFVYPSDSLAIMTKYHKLVPYYKNHLPGVARTMVTSSALDRVARDMGIPIYTTPTGWKYFVSLLLSGRISLCGEESFGQGGDYVREKDGLFAVLFWLSILAGTGKSVAGLMADFWREYGRTFYSQYSYDVADKKKADKLKEDMESASLAGWSFGGHTIKSHENFDYADPVTGEESKNKGVIITTDTGVRICFRLSGTGTVGATLRFYIEKYETDEAKFGMKGQEYLKDIYALVEEIFQLKSRFGKDIVLGAVN